MSEAQLIFSLFVPGCFSESTASALFIQGKLLMHFARERILLHLKETDTIKLELNKVVLTDNTDQMMRKWSLSFNVNSIMLFFFLVCFPREAMTDVRRQQQQQQHNKTSREVWTWTVRTSVMITMIVKYLLSVCCLLKFCPLPHFFWPCPSLFLCRWHSEGAELNYFCQLLFKRSD